MSRLVVLLSLILVAWLLLRWFIRTPPKQVIASAKKAGFALAILGLLFLVVTGRLHVLIAAAAAALPLLKRGFSLLRYLPMLSGLLGASKASRGDSFGQQRSPFSTLETRFLRASFDISTGSLDGEVLEGAFEGQFLSKMTVAQLLSLLQVCQQQDPRSAALLSAYLDRHHPSWRSQGGQTETPPSADHNMNDAEARDILGIDSQASEDDILSAHRRLIHKLHPDRGGSTYLASKINQAKDCLLK
jgi:DnaJ domain